MNILKIKHAERLNDDQERSQHHSLASQLTSASAVAISLNTDRATTGARGFLSVVFDLIKIRITFFVGMSALFGYVLSDKVVSLKMIGVSFGVFLLASASAAMNHYQERRTDALMHRTRYRPLPMGLITEKNVVTIVLVLALLGSALIMSFGNYLATGLSWLALISYNIVYTPLKRISSFAVIPGALVGVFPVLAGWVAANGALFSPRILFIAFFFFIWQIPHFWLLMELYSSDYKRAGFPTLQMKFKPSAIKAMIFFSIVILVVSSVAFFLTNIVPGPIPRVLLSLSGVLLIIQSLRLVMKGEVENRVIKSTFMKLNMYVLVVTLVIFIDNLIF